MKKIFYAMALISLLATSGASAQSAAPIQMPSVDLLLQSSACETFPLGASASKGSFSIELKCSYSGSAPRTAARTFYYNSEVVTEAAFIAYRAENTNATAAPSRASTIDILQEERNASEIGVQKTNCKVNGEYVSCEKLKEDVGGFIGMGLSILLGLVVFGIVCFVFWIVMLIHAIKYPIENKAIWIICFILFGIITAVIYYFVVKRSFVAPSGTVTLSTPLPPTV